MPAFSVRRLLPFQGATDIGGRYEFSVDATLSAKGKFAVAEGYVKQREEMGFPLLKKDGQ